MVPSNMLQAPIPGDFELLPTTAQWKSLQSEHLEVMLLELRSALPLLPLQDGGVQDGCHGPHELGFRSQSLDDGRRDASAYGLDFRGQRMPARTSATPASWAGHSVHGSLRRLRRSELEQGGEM